MCSDACSDEFTAKLFAIYKTINTEGQTQVKREIAFRKFEWTIREYRIIFSAAESGPAAFGLHVTHRCRDQNNSSRIEHDSVEFWGIGDSSFRISQVNGMTTGIANFKFIIASIAAAMKKERKRHTYRRVLVYCIVFCLLEHVFSE